ncbi:hypothetical protein DSO57_1029030 [Entomophthora muscae]|uniref:Uncharacterized protein n=1 Tax=Entomophthora muscae TaxID=34485 RepID=A0ACC2RS89_9FUNG|nr:hypothetical protein DSO57_1029030 [Entomophthora muscae]
MYEHSSQSIQKAWATVEAGITPSPAFAKFQSAHCTEMALIASFTEHLARPAEAGWDLGELWGQPAGNSTLPPTVNSSWFQQQLGGCPQLSQETKGLDDSKAEHFTAPAPIQGR